MDFVNSNGGSSSSLRRKRKRRVKKTSRYNRFSRGSSIPTRRYPAFQYKRYYGGSTITNNPLTMKKNPYPNNLYVESYKKSIVIDMPVGESEVAVPILINNTKGCVLSKCIISGCASQTSSSKITQFNPNNTISSNNTNENFGANISERYASDDEMNENFTEMGGFTSDTKTVNNFLNNQSQINSSFISENNSTNRANLQSSSTPPCSINFGTVLLRNGMDPSIMTENFKAPMSTTLLSNALSNKSVLAQKYLINDFGMIYTPNDELINSGNAVVHWVNSNWQAYRIMPNMANFSPLLKKDDKLYFIAKRDNTSSTISINITYDINITHKR